jgi:hypothetical protein
MVPLTPIHTANKFEEPMIKIETSGLQSESVMPARVLVALAV